MSSNLIKATLAADAASLGYHWVYDTSKVPDSLPKPLPLQAPESKFHSGLHAGDLTHYGVQVAVLYGSTSAKGAYDGDSFAAAMRTFWKDNSKYYVDGATKSLLAGKPPTSDDFSAVGRNAALLAVLDPVKEPQAFIDAAKDQASATHNADVALCASIVSGGDSSSRILPAVLLLAAYAQRNGADPMQGLPDFAK
eukprot:gene15604-23816_t